MTKAEEMFELAWANNEKARKLYEDTLDQIRQEAEKGNFSLCMQGNWSYAVLNELHELGFNWEVCGGRATVKWS